MIIGRIKWVTLFYMILFYIFNLFFCLYMVKVFPYIWVNFFIFGLFFFHHFLIIMIINIHLIQSSLLILSLILILRIKGFGYISL